MGGGEDSGLLLFSLDLCLNSFQNQSFKMMIV